MINRSLRLRVLGLGFIGFRVWVVFRKAAL